MKTERLTGEKLTRWLGNLIATRTIQSIVSQAGLKNDGGFDLKEAIQAIVAHFKQQAEKTSAARTEAAARRESAEAESAEIKAVQARNELMLRADGIAMWKDGFTQVRQKLAAAHYIPAQSRERLAKELRDVRVDEPEG